MGALDDSEVQIRPIDALRLAGFVAFVHFEFGCDGRSYDVSRDFEIDWNVNPPPQYLGDIEIKIYESVKFKYYV